MYQSKGETTKFTTRLRYYSFGNNAVKLKPAGTAGPAGPACGLLCVDRPANLFLNFLQGIPVVIIIVQYWPNGACEQKCPRDIGENM